MTMSASAHPSDLAPRRGPARVFERGELRFVLLGLLARKPSHGYELIKHIEERLGGYYAPSPGTVYPVLATLEQRQLIAPTAGALDARKVYAVTALGQDLLRQRADGVQAALAKLASGADAAGLRANRPAQVNQAIDRLKHTMRRHLAGPALSDAQAQAFAAILDTACQQIEALGASHTPSATDTPLRNLP